MVDKYDKVIIGSGLYGLYSAFFLGNMGYNVLVLEYDDEPFKRATYINQARIHQGYHYPRSLSTAMKAASYFRKFTEDYSFAINKEFQQIYATSTKYSWSNVEQFKKFCEDADIPLTELIPDNYFKKGMCDGAFLTKEYTYDAMILKGYFLNKINNMQNVKLCCKTKINYIEKYNDHFIICTQDDKKYKTDFILNATYASTNQISKLLGFTPFKLKYELCEVILCDVNDALKNVGFTIMDGPFFSIMPFGKTKMHSLTSVTFTPHNTSYDNLPTFKCQKNNGSQCSSLQLNNCNNCLYKPISAFPYMSSLAKKYLKDRYHFFYNHSLFSVKPILMTSEIDDSRPTVIRKLTSKPTFISILSGKINTIYDLNEVLLNG